MYNLSLQPCLLVPLPTFVVLYLDPGKFEQNFICLQVRTVSVLLPSFQIGIQNYSTTTSCQSHPNQTRSDYGKLFVVLVIIGSVCAIIIVLGLIYNCWQRRLPKMKNMVSTGWVEKVARLLALGMEEIGK